MECPYCHHDVITRSKAWEGFYCEPCDTTLHTTIIPDPDAVTTEDSPTQPGREVLYSTSFSVWCKHNQFQINYLADDNKTIIYPPGILREKQAITLPGQPLTPKNAAARLPIILLFQ